MSTTATIWIWIAGAAIVIIGFIAYLANTPGEVTVNNISTTTPQVATSTPATSTELNVKG